MILALHILIYGFARLIPGILNFFAIILYTRLIQPDDYGTYAIIVSYITFLQVIFFNWLNISTLRFMPVFKSNNEQFISSISGSFVFIALITIIPFPVLYLLIDDHSLLILSMVYLWVHAWGEFNLQISQARLKPTKYAIMTLIRSFVSVGISVTLLYLGIGIESLFYGLIIGNILSSLINSNEWISIGYRDVNWEIIKKLLRYGIPLAISTALTVLIDSSDRIILGMIDSKEAAGVYSVTYDLIQRSMGLLLVVINMSSIPIIIKSHEEGDVIELDSKIKRTLILLLLIGIPACAGVVYLEDTLSKVLLGENFTIGNSNSVISLIAIAIFLSCIKGYYLNIPFLLFKESQNQLYISLLGASINIILNIILIPFYGMEGAAYSTLITFILIVFFSWHLGKKYYKLPWAWNELIKIIISTIIMIGILLILDLDHSTQGLIISITVGALVYSICIIITNILNIRKFLLAKLN